MKKAKSIRVCSTPSKLAEIALFGDVKLILHYLKTKKVDIDTKDDSGKTAFMHARDTRSLQTLLLANANINSQDNYGTTALMRVSLNSCAELCQFLIHHQAHLNVRDVYGMTAVMYSTDEHCLHLLLQAGANPDIQLQDGTTALMQAAKNNSESICRVLTHYKADVNLQDREGRTAMMYTTDLSCLRVLLNCGGDPNIADNSGMTVLMLAASKNMLDHCQLLVQHQVNLNIQDEKGMTAAMHTTNASCLAFLLQAGADINVQDKFGKTAVTYAAEKKLIENCFLMFSPLVMDK